MLIKVSSAANIGLETIRIDVEVNISAGGLPKFYIVGLPSKAVDESRQRVVTAIVNSDVSFPRKRITVNLAPADIPKEGSFYDLPISVGILTNILEVELPPKALFFGELSLDGSLRHTKGVFLLALFARENGYQDLFVPVSTAGEALSVSGIRVFPVHDLKELIEHFKGMRQIRPCLPKKVQIRKEKEGREDFDMKYIIDNEFAKRAMEIVAAGGHNIIMTGPPGAGKTMLARSLPGILPPLSESESIEVTKIYSATGNIPPNGSMITARPFRSPHHTTSTVGLVGGGSKPQPGEVSLAHRGVLFLDEFSEFTRFTLDALRQPLEDGVVTISRSRGRMTFPADFMLVASTNPCPCGYLGHPTRECVCTALDIARYQKKVTGPIMDRIDLHVTVEPVPIEKLSIDALSHSGAESSEQFFERIRMAREMQEKRFENSDIHTNSEMTNRDIQDFVFLKDDAEKLLAEFMDRFQLSTRSYFRLIRVGRTIADLAGSGSVEKEHIAEALQYRVRRGGGK